MTIDLERTVDILERIGKLKRDKLLIGFSAEDEGAIDKKAEEKLKKKNLDLIVVNDISQKGIGFMSDMNAVKIIDQHNQIIDIPKMPKIEVAKRIFDYIEKMIDIV